MRILLIGHPYAPIGMGEQIASFSMALDSVYVPHKIYDIFGTPEEQKDKSRPWLKEKETNDPNWGDIRIFHINGDEIENCLNVLKQRGFKFEAGKNIIVPAWELSKYPEVWRDKINLFDEIWAISYFVKEVFSDNWVKPKVKYVGQATERRKGVLYPRKYFGIRDSALVFLGFFDQSSYFTRKNPYALLEFYKKLRERYPYGDFQLVLKVKNINKQAQIELEKLDENVIIINDNLSYDEVTSLIDCCDVFVSLHRSEGFGRGPAEAVLRGKRAIVTDYGGVRDYSDDKAILKVSYSLVEVKEGEYPHSEGQLWAEPNINEAVGKASMLIEEWKQGFTNAHFFEQNPDAGDIVWNIASNLAVGERILRNILEG